MADTRPNGTPPIDEGDLLALVEGQALPAARAAAVQRALDGDPSLARRIEAMRRDRGTLALFAGERAPSGLIEAVMAAVEPTLERRMLLGLEQGRPVSDRLPISVVQPARRPTFATTFVRRAWPLAAAAGVLLAISAAYLLVPAMKPSRPGMPPIADAGPIEAPAGALAPDRPKVEPGPVEPETPTLIAKSDPDAPLPEIAPEDVAATTLVAAAAPAELPGIDTSRALRLASQRRLVIVVRAADVAAAADGLERLASRRGAACRVSPQVPAAVLAALTRSTDPSPPVPQMGRFPEETLLFDGPRNPMMRYLESPRPAPPIVEPAPGDRVCVLESRLDSGAFDAMRSAIKGAGARLEFRVLDEPLPDDGEVLHPSAVLWWDQPPSTWTRWAAIPVVVESGRE